MMARRLTARFSAGATADAAGRARRIHGVAADYDRRGRSRDRAALARLSGEIDLIARDGDGIVFIEVKKARDHAPPPRRPCPPGRMRRLCGARGRIPRDTA